MDAYLVSQHCGPGSRYPSVRLISPRGFQKSRLDQVSSISQLTASFRSKPNATTETMRTTFIMEIDDTLAAVHHAKLVEASAIALDTNTLT